MNTNSDIFPDVNNPENMLTSPTLILWLENHDLAKFGTNDGCQGVDDVIETLVELVLNIPKNDVLAYIQEWSPKLMMRRHNYGPGYSVVIESLPHTEVILNKDPCDDCPNHPCTGCAMQ
mgnify:CR=1 FL=1